MMTFTVYICSSEGHVVFLKNYQKSILLLASIQLKSFLNPVRGMPRYVIHFKYTSQVQNCSCLVFMYRWEETVFNGWS